MITIILHVSNSEPIKVDVEELPNPKDVAIIGTNPRDKTDKEPVWLDEGVTTVIFPWHRINYVQVLPDPGAEDELLTFYREE